ncbi:MAG: YIP1 family protein [Vicinamibacteria bacterium]|jgi:hypothetical protein|nr:YIP1 family protein [Vicinamibacteria bacterium]
MAIPFERGAGEGLVGGFAETVMRSLSDPVGLFRGAEVKGVGRALAYATAIGTFVQCVGVAYLLLLRSLVDIEAFAPEPMRQALKDAMNPVDLGFQLILTPVQTVVGVLLFGAIAHGLLSATGTVRLGFEGTVAATAYSYGPMLLAVIPFCGAFVGFVWSLVLLILGLSTLQEAGVGRALLATLVAGTACCCVGFLAQIAIAPVVILVRTLITG